MAQCPEAQPHAKVVYLEHLAVLPVVYDEAFKLNLLAQYRHADFAYAYLCLQFVFQSVHDLIHQPVLNAFSIQKNDGCGYGDSKE